MISNEFLCGFVVFVTGAGNAQPTARPGAYNIRVTLGAAPGNFRLHLGSALNPPSGDDLDADWATSLTTDGRLTGCCINPDPLIPGDYILHLWEAVADGALAPGHMAIAEGVSGGTVVRVAIKRVEPRTS